MPISELPENKPAAPNDLTELAESKPALPNNLTELAESTPDAPNNLTELAESTPAAPNNLTELAESKPVVPNNLTEIAAVSPAAPNTLSLTDEGVIPRSITPVFNLNFAGKSYQQDGSAISLLDVATYTRTSSATYLDRYIDQSGNYSYILKNDFVGTVTNIFSYSEQFDNSDWVKSFATVTPNKALSPFGERTADLIKPTIDDTSSHFISQSRTVPAGKITLSCYAKSAGYDWVYLTTIDGDNNQYRRYFNIKSGIIGSESGSGVASMKYCGDGWYRISVSTDISAAASASRIQYIYIAEKDSDLTFAGDTSKGVYVWGAQIEAGNKANSYVKTLSTSSISDTFTSNPRFEYDASNGQALGYLSEPASTNLFTYSEDFSQADWTKTETTVSSNDGIAPDGTSSADFIAPTVNSGSHYIQESANQSGYTNISFFVKPAGYNWVMLRTIDGDLNIYEQYFNILDGTKGTDVGSGVSDIKPMGNGWYRISATTNVNAAGASAAAQRLYIADADNSNSFVGDTGKGVLVWGAQGENGVLSTSYIRTDGATATRNAELLKIDYPGDKFDANSKMTVVASAKKQSDNTTSFNTIWDMTGSYIRTITYDGNSQTNSQAYHGTTGRLVGDTSDSASHRFGYVFDGQNLKVYFDGALTGTWSEIQDAGTFSEIDIGSRLDANQLSGHIKDFVLYDVALNDTEVSLA